MPDEPQVFSNRYELLREIARGGMAEVYLAHDRRLNRPVALKVLTAELSRDPSFVERFRREAQAAAGLNHPNIVSVFDWGQEAGTYFIVMEYVEGQSLRELLRERGPVTAARAAEIGADIGAALAFANQRGVVHRDVKPGNVLITAAGQVKVTDFGIARAGAGDGLTQTGNVMGTAAYFSPEQAQGLPVDGRSDVYALGVALYEMVCGAPPFSGDNPVSVAYQHVRETPVALSRRVPGIPPPFERIVTTALAKDPAHRYQSADDLRADLLRFRRNEPLADVPLTARVTTVGDTGASGATVTAPVAGARVAAATRPAAAPARRRNPWGVAVVFGVLLALLGVITFLIVGRLGDTGTGAHTVAVPPVVGQPLDQATNTLQHKGFEVKVARVTNDLPVDTVVRQDPDAGTKLGRGETVTLTVSSGPGTVAVPNVVGQQVADAKALLVSQGFNVTTESQAGDKDPGTVIGQDPPANANVAKGSTVGLVVSTGPSTVRVPNVIGLDQATAANQLGQAGFKVTTTTQPSGSVPAGNVISTNPPANTSATKGTTVTIVVSSGPQQVAVPDVRDDDQATAQTTLTGAGLVADVRSVPSKLGKKGLVVSQSPAPGTMVNPGSTVTIDVGDGTLP